MTSGVVRRTACTPASGGIPERRSDTNQGCCWVKTPVHAAGCTAKVSVEQGSGFLDKNFINWVFTRVCGFALHRQRSRQNTITGSFHWLPRTKRKRITDRHTGSSPLSRGPAQCQFHSVTHTHTHTPVHRHTASLKGCPGGTEGRSRNHCPLISSSDNCV